jgi:RNase P protein component
VSGKIHKHAVQRNIIRRAFYAAREDQIDKAIHNHYYKVFVVVHPEHCEQIQQSIATETIRKKTKKEEKSSDSSSEPSSDRPQIF